MTPHAVARSMSEGRDIPPARQELRLELSRPEVVRLPGERPALLITEGLIRLTLSFPDRWQLKKLVDESRYLAAQGPSRRQLPLFERTRQPPPQIHALKLTLPEVSRAGEALVIRDSGVLLTLSFLSTDELRAFTADMASLIT